MARAVRRPVLVVTHPFRPPSALPEAADPVSFGRGYNRHHALGKPDAKYEADGHVFPTQLQQRDESASGVSLHRVQVKRKRHAADNRFFQRLHRRIARPAQNGATTLVPRGEQVVPIRCFKLAGLAGGIVIVTRRRERRVDCAYWSGWRKQDCPVMWPAAPVILVRDAQGM